MVVSYVCLFRHRCSSPDRKQHSKQEHLYAILQAAKEHGVPKVFVHFFGDGRDTEKRSGAGYLQELLEAMKEIGIGQISTIVGRYYAMDRDKRWERIEIALKGMVLGEGTETDDPVKAVEEVYAKGGDKDADEFLKPIIVGGKEARIQGEFPPPELPGWWTRLTRDRRRQRLLLQLPLRPRPTDHSGPR